MVQSLHVRGYQRIRISPGLSACCSWRCSFTSVDNISCRNGAFISDWDKGVHYSTTENEPPFGWKDAVRASPGRLAEMFIERFPHIAEAGAGPDWEYAGWYVWMLHLTYPRTLPIAYADCEMPEGYLETDTGVRIPIPPPGTGWDPFERAGLV